ncbi:MAG: hypothetical protein ABI835_12690 [Chloroflexota bacterium]
MRTVKAQWKRAPIAQRRVSSEWSTPKARFTRSQRSGTLPSSLPSSRGNRSAKPLLIFAGAVLLISLGVALVIAVGAYIRSEQAISEIEWRAGYYGRPTQPFATLAPDTGQIATDAAPTAQSALFPALASPNDPGWVNGSAMPLAASFALYASPILTDVPIRTVEQAMEIAFITQIEWGIWVQVRLGDTIGWVDRSTVRLAAS